MYRKRALVSTWQATAAACLEHPDDIQGIAVLYDRIVDGIGNRDPVEVVDLDLTRKEWDLICWVYGPTENFEEVAL